MAAWYVQRGDARMSRLARVGRSSVALGHALLVRNKTLDFFEKENRIIAVVVKAGERYRKIIDSLSNSGSHIPVGGGTKRKQINCLRGIASRQSYHCPE